MCRPKDGYPGILAKAKIEALEAELRGIQIAYDELQAKLDKVTPYLVIHGWDGGIETVKPDIRVA